VLEHAVSATPSRPDCAATKTESDDRAVDQGETPAAFGTDAGKASKREAQYGPGTGRQHCGICRYYLVLRPQLKVGACSKVRGPIRPQDWCRFFASGGATHRTVAIDRAPPKAVGAKEVDR
jgi:hypothetical protein